MIFNTTRMQRMASLQYMNVLGGLVRNVLHFTMGKLFSSLETCCFFNTDFRLHS